MAVLSLRFLGAPLLEIDGQPVRLDTRKAVALLAYLAATGVPATRETLVTLLWSRYGRSQGQAALRRTLSTLRREVGATRIITEGESVALSNEPDVMVDVSRIRELLELRASHSHDHSAVCSRCLPLLREAAELHRGDFLQGFTLKDSVEFDDWQFFVTEDLRLALSKILYRLALCLAAAGEHEEALASARRRLSLDPLDESAHAMLMRHYVWSGNRSAALRQYEECVRVLESELQTMPARELTRLRDDIRASKTPQPPAFDSVEIGARGGDFVTAGSTEWEVATVIVVRWTGDQKTGFARIAAAVVARLDGTVVYGSPAELVASFGKRSDSESNPEMAVRAASELSAAAKVARLELRIGIATGAAPDHAATEAERPVGGSVAFATQIAERALPGTTLVAERTYRLTRDAFRYEAVGLRGALGVSKPLAYRLLGLARVPRKTRDLPGKRTALIGRDDELRRLVAAYERAFAEGGQIVVITGEAGIGKSRLIAELAEYAERSGKNDPSSPLWLEGRCLPPTCSVAYWPFVDMLHELFAQEDRELARLEEVGRNENNRPLVRSSQRPANEEAGVSIAEAIRRARELTTVPGSSQPERELLTPEQAKERTFGALSTLFSALAAQRPLVLVFEDLHWADELSLELIGALIEKLGGVPALIVCIHRNDAEHKSRHLAPDAARRRPGELTEIHLREMTPAESARLLDSVAGGDTLSIDQRAMALGRAAGNPFFLVELVGALVSGNGGERAKGTDDVRPISGRDRLAVQTNGMSRPVDAASGVPEGIKAVILSRYDRLPDNDKKLLGAAATIGRVFPARLLEALRIVKDSTARLEVLEDRGFVFVERTLPEVEYSFKHVLTQEAIYRDLFPKFRGELHRRVAVAYESLSENAEELYCEQLAHHYDLAGVRDRAIDSYFRSGERARRLYANEAAVTYFSRGLELIRADPPSSGSESRELEFLIALGVLLVLVRGHYSSEVEAAYVRAREIAERIGSAEQLFQVMLGLRRLRFARGQHRTAAECGEQMLELGRRARSAMLTSRAHMMLTESLTAIAEFSGVLEHSAAGRKLYEPAESRLHLVEFGNDTGVGFFLYEAMALWHLGYADQARRAADAAVATAREIDHPFTLVFALNHAAMAAFMWRDAACVAKLAGEQIEIAQREKFPLYTGFGPVLLGWALGMLGEDERGAAMFPDAFETLHLIRPFAVLFSTMRAELYFRMGRIGEAMDALDAGFASVRTSDAHLWEPELSRLRGEIGRSVGEARVDTERWLARAMRIAHHQKSPALELRAAMAVCRLEHSGESAGRARDRLSELYTGFSEGFDTDDLREARRIIQGGEPEAGHPPIEMA